MSAVSEATLEEWKRIQNDLKAFVKTEDKCDFKSISRVAGLDISMHKNNKEVVCVTLVVLDYKSLKVIYEDTHLETTTTPYVPSFLAFREADVYAKTIDKLRDNPEVFPEVTLIDGNGLLHRNGFGSACHVGVVCNIPTIGVAKNLFHIPEKGIEKDTEKILQLKKKGDKFPIKSSNNETLGMALRTSGQATKPMYVSVGHDCSLESAVEIVLRCCDKYRIPEPIRQADIRSRQFLRDKFPEDYHLGSDISTAKTSSSVKKRSLD